MELITECRRCREPFTPAHADYVRGRWQVCPRCRDRTADVDLSRSVVQRAAPQPLPTVAARDAPHRSNDPQTYLQRVSGPLNAPRRTSSIHWKSRKV